MAIYTSGSVTFTVNVPSALADLRAKLEGSLPILARAVLSEAAGAAISRLREADTAIQYGVKEAIESLNVGVAGSGIMMTDDPGTLTYRYGAGAIPFDPEPGSSPPNSIRDFLAQFRKGGITNRVAYVPHPRVAKVKVQTLKVKVESASTLRREHVARNLAARQSAQTRIKIYTEKLAQTTDTTLRAEHETRLWAARGELRLLTTMLPQSMVASMVAQVAHLPSPTFTKVYDVMAGELQRHAGNLESQGRIHELMLRTTQNRGNLSARMGVPASGLPKGPRASTVGHMAIQARNMFLKGGSLYGDIRAIDALHLNDLGGRSSGEYLKSLLPALMTRENMLGRRTPSVLRPATAKKGKPFGPAPRYTETRESRYGMYSKDRKK